jgi:hypothetical protein
MRQQYDFSGAVRGKYAGKVDTTKVRRMDSADATQKNGASGTLRKRASGKSPTKLQKK